MEKETWASSKESMSTIQKKEEEIEEAKRSLGSTIRKLRSELDDRTADVERIMNQESEQRAMVKVLNEDKEKLAKSLDEVTHERDELTKGTYTLERDAEVKHTAITKLEKEIEVMKGELNHVREEATRTESVKTDEVLERDAQILRLQR